MARFIFCCDSYHGHVYPLLKLVQELTLRDAEVICYVANEFKDAVEATGAMFRSVPSRNMAKSRQEFFEIPLINENHSILQKILNTARMDQPEYIVYDAMCLWGMLLAKVIKVPAVRIHGHFPINNYFHPFNPFSPLHPVKEKNEEFDNDMQKLCQMYSLPIMNYHEVVYHAEPLNIVRLLDTFFPNKEVFDKSFQFVGPFIDIPRESTSSHLERVLYISLGTTGNNNIPAFYDICLSAFGNRSQQVVIATGDKIDYEIFGPLPENIHMSPSVPQMDILRQADAFITHGGANSIMEAIYYGVPMIVIPLTLEQTVMAERVEELRLGMVVKNIAFVTAYMLRKAVAQLKADQEIQAAVQHLQDRTRKSGGYKLAADIIMQSVA